MSNFFDLVAPDAHDPTQRDAAIPEASGGVLVTFFEYDEYQGYQSKIQGKPVYEKKTYIRKIADNHTDFQRRMRESDKLKYPKQWAAYEANKDSHGIIGTMLDDYAKASGKLNNADLQILKDNRVYTVEQLAELTDTHLQNIGSNARKYRTDAAVWLEELKKGTVERQLMAELDKLKKQVEAKDAPNQEEVQKYKKELEEANKKTAELADMNSTILEQYKTLAAEVEKLKSKKKPK